ncbi:MAG: ADP-ribosylglycohydrolase family protein [Clostridiales Family XIII bacterium]|jgi:ADP-ribosylglycohydrolase|nr:ADP-ribosylglycohydrolase family protein [Clostridiales Family XIII bacterium]
MKIDREHFRGCLIGGAASDARAYGTRSGGLNLISDNTQMASFTLDGLVWAADRAKRKGVYAYIPCLFYSYQKWHYTQTGNLADDAYSFILDGEILRWEELYARRGQGTTSLTALAGSINNRYGTMQNRINSSKGCGGVMRSAPIGMYFCRDAKAAFRIGCEAAALTHGHIDAMLPAGCFAFMISGILQGGGIRETALAALDEMKAWPGHERCLDMALKAMRLADSGAWAGSAMRELGEGLTGDELIALALYCALSFDGDMEALIDTVSGYDGNSYSLSTVCGSIVGAYMGCSGIPYKWIKDLELLELLVLGADKLLDAVG